MREQYLEWYKQDRFTSSDVTRATGLSERFQRELLKNRMITAVPQARTKKRLFDRRMIMRMGLISNFNNFGLSLPAASQIISECKSVEDCIFQTVDPICLSSDRDITELSPILPRALHQESNSADKFDWLDPSIQPSAQGDDFIIKIIDGDCVVVQTKTMDLIESMGELKNYQKLTVVENMSKYIADNPSYFVVPENFLSEQSCQHPNKSIFDNKSFWNEVGKLCDDFLKNISFELPNPNKSRDTKPFNCNNMRWKKRLYNYIYEAPATTLSINASLSLKMTLRKLFEVNIPMNL
jgi:hypothetical protein